MPTTDATPTDVTIPLPPDGALSESGHISVLDTLSEVRNVRAQYRPGHVADGLEISESVAVYIGMTILNLPPAVWETVIGAVQRVLPHSATELSTYTACEGADAEQVSS